MVSKKNLYPHDVWVIENNNGSWSHPKKAAESSLTFTGSKIAVTEQNGREVIHLVWADQSTDTEFGVENPPPFNASNYVLYSYRNQNRETWSVPDTLYHTPKRSLRFSPNLISKDGSLYFVFTAFDTTYTQSVEVTFIKERKKDQWKPHIPAALLGADGDLEILDDGTFFLSYIRPDTAWAQNNLSGDVNSVFVKTSSDGGKTWNESRIQRSGTTPAYSPKIETDGSGNVHLLWRQDTVGDRNADNLAHSWTADGDEWTEPGILISSSEAGRGYIYNYDTVATNSGAVHVLFVRKAGLGISPGGIYHAYWNGNSWKISEPLFDFPGLSHLAVTYDESKKQLHLVFTAVPDNREQEYPWELYYSVYQE